MKAYPLRAVGQIEYEDVQYPECNSGWCIVKVKAAGICSSDIPRIYKKGTYHFPTICGHEFSGVVHEVADPEYSNLIGKKVGVFPLIPCRECEQCKLGKYEMCSHYDYIGSRRDGAFAEYVAVPIWNLIELSSDTSFEEAAMMEPLAVSLHAMKMLNIKDSDNVAIVGTGMIAFAAAQWGVALGAKSVTVLGRSDSKRKIAESIPGILYMNINECDRDYDAVLEAVGSNDAINKSICVTKAGGKIVLMGNPEGDINLSQDVYWKILRKQLVVSGTWNSSYEKNMSCDWSEVSDALAEHKMEVKALISHRFTQDHLIDALELMKEHKEPYCKVMTIWNKE